MEAPFHDTALPPVPLPLSDSSKPAVFRVLPHIRQRFCPESPKPPAQGLQTAAAPEAGSFLQIAP